VYLVDVEVCPYGGGAMRIVAFVAEPTVVRRILARLERRGIAARRTVVEHGGARVTRGAVR
jgi:hypothetical protein